MVEQHERDLSSEEWGDLQFVDVKEEERRVAISVMQG